MIHSSPRPICRLFDSACSPLNIGHLPACDDLLVHQGRQGLEVLAGLIAVCRLACRCTSIGQTTPWAPPKEATAAYPALHPTTALPAAPQVDIIIFPSPAPEDYEGDHFPHKRCLGWPHELGEDILIPCHQAPTVDGTRIVALTGLNGANCSSPGRAPSPTPLRWQSCRSRARSAAAPEGIRHLGLFWPRCKALDQTLSGGGLCLDTSCSSQLPLQKMTPHGP